MASQDLAGLQTVASRDLFSALPESLLVCHVALAATSQELSRFCMTSSDAARLEPLLARLVAETQHGVFELVVDGEVVDRPFTLAELYHTLDSVRDRASFEFTRPFMAAVLKPERREGSPRREPDFMLVDVGGGRTGYRTVAACPPMRGDYWRLPVPLRRGWYRLEVSGWRNPHHGILDITLDNEPVSPAEGLDWYAEFSTVPYMFPPMLFEVKATGSHVLAGYTNRCHTSALGAKYWMCLDLVRILPVDEVEPEILTIVPGTRLLPQRQQPLRHRPAPAQRIFSLGGVASILSGSGLKFGHFAAQWAAALLLRPLYRLAERLGCPWRRWQR